MDDDSSATSHVAIRKLPLASDLASTTALKSWFNIPKAERPWMNCGSAAGANSFFVDGKLYTRSAARTSSLAESGRQRWAKPIWKRLCDLFPFQRFNVSTIHAANGATWPVKPPGKRSSAAGAAEIQSHWIESPRCRSRISRSRLFSGPFSDPSFHLLVRNNTTLFDIALRLAHCGEKSDFVSSVTVIDVVW